MKKTYLSMAVLLGLATWVSAGEPPRELINVHCQALGEDGFVSKDVGDSTRDVAKALEGKKKTLRLVDDPSQADVVITVVDRAVEGTGEREYRTTTSRSKSGKRRTTRTSSKEKTVKVVYAELQAGKFTQKMTGVDSAFWSFAASNLARDIDSWLKENHEQIMALRAKRAQADASDEAVASDD
jgi:hypothetical protein